MKKCANCARENQSLSWLDEATPYFGRKLCAPCRIEKLLQKSSLPTAHVTGLYFALLTLLEQPALITRISQQIKRKMLPFVVFLYEDTALESFQEFCQQFKKPQNTALQLFIDEPPRVLEWYETEGVALMRTVPSAAERALLSNWLTAFHVDVALVEQMVQQEAEPQVISEVTTAEVVDVPAHLYGIPCAYCGEQAESIDHIVPRAFGGPDHESNYVAACLYCNRLKGHDTLQQFLTFRIHFDLAQWRQFKRHNWTKQEIAAYMAK